LRQQGTTNKSSSAMTAGENVAIAKEVQQIDPVKQMPKN
jgi:hypothetical protein